VAPLQETPATTEQRTQSVLQSGSESKKKRKHRGKKSKRNRRQSFAAPSEESSLPPTIPEIMTEQNGTTRPDADVRKPFYRLGHSGGNLSTTSLESEALLDHRYGINWDTSYFLESQSH
jgi:magnesium transporter